MSWLVSSSTALMTSNSALMSFLLMALLLNHNGTKVKRKPILEGNLDNVCPMQRFKEWHIHFICTQFGD